MSRFNGLFVLIALFLTSCGAGKKAPVSLFPEAAYVQIYVDADDDKMTEKAGPKLNEKQRAKLQSIVFIETVDPDREMTACFVPHHWFRYFDAKGNQIGEVAVCFCCFQVSIDPAPASAYSSDHIVSGDMQKLEKLVHELGQPTNIACDDQ